MKQVQVVAVTSSWGPAISCWCLDTFSSEDRSSEWTRLNLCVATPPRSGLLTCDSAGFSIKSHVKQTDRDETCGGRRQDEPPPPGNGYSCGDE